MRNTAVQLLCSQKYLKLTQEAGWKGLGVLSAVRQGRRSTAHCSASCIGRASAPQHDGRWPVQLLSSPIDQCMQFVLSTGLLLGPRLLACNIHWPGTDKQLLVLTQPSTPLRSSAQLTTAVFQLLILPKMRQAQTGMPGSDQLPSCQVTTGTPERQDHKGRVSASCRLIETMLTVLPARN